MPNQQPIPNLQWVRGKPFVRINIKGQRYSAPCTNEWLIDSGQQPARSLKGRVERVIGTLRVQVAKEAQNGFQEQEPLTISEGVKQFLQHRKQQPSSARPTKKQLERLEATLIEGTSNRPSLVQVVGKRKRLPAIQPSDLEGYELALEKLRFRHNSIRSWMSDCRTFFNWCLESGLVTRSPIRKGRYSIPPVKGTSSKEGQYTNKELEQIQGLMKPDSNLSRFWMVSRNTGARRVEILRLRFRDVDLAKRQIAIHGAAKNPRKEVKPRYLQLLPKLAELLESIRGEPDWFICSLSDVPWTQNACRNACRLYSRKHGIRLGSQRMRRTYAQMLLTAGLPLDQIAYALGNSPETLVNWYLVPQALTWDARTMQVLEGR